MAEVLKKATAIDLVHVSKVYQRYGARHFASLKSALLKRSILRDLRPTETFEALKDVSFAVPTGSTFGVIGRNGSGKSTALKLVAGITKPTSGTVTVKGRISALIELGAGFHPEISGRENVFINGIMLGMSKRDIQGRFDEIVEFAEMADFIDEPVKSYSSGMYMRLGFAVAIHVNPDVLLVDEVLAVGDEGFTHKCLDKFAEFKRRGKTVLLVTHALAMVERFCDDAIWLDAGRKCAEGDPKRVIGAYVGSVAKQEATFLAVTDAKIQAKVKEAEPPPAPPVDPAGPSDMFQVSEGRWGTRTAEVTAVAFLDQTGQPNQVFQTGDPVTIRLSVRAARPMDDFVFGVGIFNAEGVCIYATNTDVEDFKSDQFSGDGRVDLVIDSLDLVEGTYKVDVAVHSIDGAPYDYHRLLHTFRVKSPVKDVGVYRPKHHWAFSPDIKFKAK